MKTNRVSKPPDINKWTDLVAKTLNIKSCADFKNVMQKQLLTHKRTQKSRTDASNDVVVNNNDYELTE